MVQLPGRRALQVALVVLASSVALSTPGAQAEPLPEVPRHLPATIRDWLDGTRAALLARSAAYAAHRINFLERCGPGKISAGDQTRVTACRSELEAMHADLASIRRDKRVFRMRVASTEPACTDPRVVCAAGMVRDGAWLTDQVPELKGSPAADVISKGFQAVVNHDWPVALAWWQTAQQRDPGNEALRRSVDLAQWMVDRRRVVAAGAAPEPPLSLAIQSAARNDYAGAIRQFEIAKRQHPTSAAYLDDMIVIVRQRQAAADREHWDRLYRANQNAIAEVLREQAMGHLAKGERDRAQFSFEEAEMFSRP